VTSDAQRASRGAVVPEVSATEGEDPGQGAPAIPPPAPDVARVVFSERLSLAERFTAILADSGVSHGLVGPREVPRLWERHVLNCAVVHPRSPRGRR